MTGHFENGRWIETPENDGLSKPWFGNVYLNPPYGRNIWKWVQKAYEEYHSGAVHQAILLLPARTDTKWFNLISCFPWCAVRGRLKFSGCDNSAPFPSAIFYLGNKTVEFIEAFGALGPIYELSE